MEKDLNSDEPAQFEGFEGKYTIAKSFKASEMADILSDATSVGVLMGTDLLAFVTEMSDLFRNKYKEHDAVLSNGRKIGEVIETAKDLNLGNSITSLALANVLNNMQATLDLKFQPKLSLSWGLKAMA